MGHIKYPTLSTFWSFISLSSISSIVKEWRSSTLSSVSCCLRCKSFNKDSASFTVGNPMEMNHQPAVASNIHRKGGVVSPSKDFCSRAVPIRTQIKRQYRYCLWLLHAGKVTQLFLPPSYTAVSFNEAFILIHLHLQVDKKQKKDGLCIQNK